MSAIDDLAELQARTDGHRQCLLGHHAWVPWLADELASKRRGDPEERIAHNRALPVCGTCQRIWDKANGGAS